MKKKLKEVMWYERTLTSDKDCSGWLPCDSCAACRAANYNKKHIGLDSIDRVGTDAYFAAVRSEQLHALSHRTTVLQPRKAPRYKGPVMRSALPTPQPCWLCQRRLQVGEPCWAQTEMPTVICLPCASPRMPLKFSLLTKIGPEPGPRCNR